MPQTTSQDPIDLIQINDTGNDTTNVEGMPSPNPISTQEETLASNTKRTPSSTPAATQRDPPTSHQHQMVAHEPSEESSTQSRSSSPPAVPSSKTDIPSEAPPDTQDTPNSQTTQVEQTQLPLPQEDLGSSKDPLETYDWVELEERFQTEIEKCANRESGIQEEFYDLLKLFTTWTTSGSVHEENRAGKRLRTRSAYVQHREKTLEEKRAHYVKVVTAFENALALLSES